MTQRFGALREAFDRHGLVGVNRWLLQHFATGHDGRASVQRAALCAASGDADAVFEHLDGALPARDPAMIDLAVSPLWDPLRGDPRFAARLERIGLDTRITSTPSIGDEADGDHARDVIGAGDVNEVGAVLYVPSDFIGHPTGVGHRRVNHIRRDAQRGELERGGHRVVLQRRLGRAVRDLIGEA
jgi:hypothetical protein